MPKQKQPISTAASSSVSALPVPPAPIDTVLLDLYTDYLISSYSSTTATGMSASLDHVISHDTITRFLSAREYTNKDLWKLVKPVIRQVETDDGVLSLDDTIEEKAYTDENDIIAWHFDHTVGRSVKGVNIVNCVYTNAHATVPLGMVIVEKDVPFTDPNTGKTKRKSSVTKNEIARDLIGATINNQVKWSYVLADSWFSSQENMEFVIGKGRHFVFALKSNRTAAINLEQKRKGVFQAVESLDWETQPVQMVYLKGMNVPVKVTRQIFTNEDGTTGILYLATDDLTLGYTEITAIYQKRWKVEEYHKSIKTNIGLAKSPTKTVTSQSNHFFASAVAYHKLERLSHATKTNQFALKAKLYIKALQASQRELTRLREIAGASYSVGFSGGFA